jgi:hypothetical protein
MTGGAFVGVVVVAVVVTFRLLIVFCCIRGIGTAVAISLFAIPKFAFPVSGLMLQLARHKMSDLLGLQPWPSKLSDMMCGHFV